MAVVASRQFGGIVSNMWLQEPSFYRALSQRWDGLRYNGQNLLLSWDIGEFGLVVANLRAVGMLYLNRVYDSELFFYSFLTGGTKRRNAAENMQRL